MTQLFSSPYWKKNYADFYGIISNSKDGDHSLLWYGFYAKRVSNKIFLFFKWSSHFSFF